MTLARAIRYLLALASLMVVVWSFVDVGARIARKRTSDKIELTIMHWGDPDEDKILDTLKKEFEETHPNIHINRLNPGNDFSSKLKTMFTASTPPDLFYLGSENVALFAGLELLLPIDKYLDREEQTEAGRIWLDDFYPILLDAYRFNGNRVGGGQHYGLPKDFTTCVVYVNLDLFERAGVKVPYDGWTWDEYEIAMKQIAALRDQPEFKNAGRRIYGATYDIWPSSLLNFIWNYGGNYFDNNDFRKPMLSSPRTQAALELIRRTRLVDRSVFNVTGAVRDGSQEFFTGNIGCIGLIGRWKCPHFRDIKTFRWDVVPMPHAPDVKPTSQIFTTAWTISATTKYPDECYELMKFLCGAKGQAMASRLGLAIPSLKSVANSEAFLDPATLPEHDEVFLRAVPNARIQQMPPDFQEFNRIVKLETDKAITTGRQSCETVGAQIDRQWLELLDSPLKRTEFPRMNWPLIGGAALTALIATTLVIYWRGRRENIGPLDRRIERTGWLFISPWLAGFLLLTLAPMVLSLLLSMAKWTALTPLSAAQFVGTANYAQMFTRDPDFTQSLKVTAKYAAMVVPVSQIAALAVALLMNSRVRGITVFRTIYFVPSVVSGAALSLLWLMIYNNEYGMLNVTLRGLFARPGLVIFIIGCTVAAIGGVMVVVRAFSDRGQGRAILITATCGALLIVVGAIVWWMGWQIEAQPPNWFGVDTTVDPPRNDAARWAVPAFVLMSIWGVGSGMIIYLAGLKGVPSSYYEAATIDGAGPLRKLWNVTLPMLSPLIFFQVVMGIIGSFQIFTQAYLMSTGTDTGEGSGTENATLFYVVNLFQRAFQLHQMGYASAMAWILFLIVLGLTVIVFRSSRNVVYYEGLKS